ncbi:MAG TPA: ATP-binding protein [Kofleriaceae bacterium]|nr:ATP-binding protein [Kofleriaceae bacterium]
MSAAPDTDADGHREVLAGGGELGALMRATDWAATRLGPVRTWPASLRSALGICLGARFPIAIYWGEQLALLYNDAWSPIPGTKHPWALGRPAHEVWPEIWESIAPLFEQVMTTGEATYSEDSLLPLHRHGYTEECYFNFTFSPIRGERGRVDGVFNAVIETTFRVISERRTRVLRELAERTTGARSAEEACARAAASLQTATHDVPFCALYLADAAQPVAHLAACAGVGRGDPLAPERVSLEDGAAAPWPLAAVRASGRVQVVRDLPARAGGAPGGPWPEPARAALVAPRVDATTGQTRGFAILGASPRRAIDDAYVQLAERVASQVAMVIANANAYDEERRRAERLAEQTQLALARAHRQTERELEDLYALLMQVPAQIVVRRGPDHVCVFQNEQSLRLIDQRGKPVRETWPQLAAAQLAIYDRVLATGEPHVEREIAMTRDWGDGQVRARYWNATYAPLRLPDGRIDGVITIAFEVTDTVIARQQAAAAEAERATAQERLRAALAASSIGTYFWNLRTNAVEHDAGVRRMFGFAPGEGGPVEDYTARVHPDDRGTWLAALARCANEGADFQLEYRVVWPDGTVRWIADKGRMIRDPDGAPLHLAGAIVDITDSKRLAEEALAASRAKDEFLAVLGHELRNPLAPMMTGIELLKLRGVTMTKELLTIERQVRHLARLVDDLLDISRITRGLVELQRERLALDAAIAKGIEIASPLLEQKEHRVSLDVAPGLHVDGDPVRLAQVFSNLLTNAARYTPRGGNVRVSAHRDGAHAVVRVTDDGIGIAPELLGRIFDLFVQGGRTIARSEGGLGIGLAVVRSLVQLHGGEVTAHSAGPGQGSELVVRLPLAGDQPPDREPRAVRPAELPEARHKRRVLVVDDNVEAAELISGALRALGHEVAVAHDGAEALKLAGRFRPEVAVLDIGLPVMDGYELARRLREHPDVGPGRLIALTGYGQAGDRARSRDAGFDVHLIKPVDVRALADAIGAA